MTIGQDDGLFSIGAGWKNGAANARLMLSLLTWIAGRWQDQKRSWVTVSCQQKMRARLGRWLNAGRPPVGTTVRVVYAGCKIVVISRHSGRLLHMRDKRNTHGVSYICPWRRMVLMRLAREN